MNIIISYQLLVDENHTMNKSLSSLYSFLYSLRERNDKEEFESAVPSANATMLDEKERIIFFILYLIIFSLSMIGNTATLCTIYERNIRLIQKMLIISLALSDITVCVFVGVNNMINFSHPMFNWVLGEFLCSFVPYMQTTGSVANSITMVSIACDRYVNILHPTSKQMRRWNPNIWGCLVLLIAIWGISAGVSYPIYSFHFLLPFLVIITDEDNNVLSTDLLQLEVCMTSSKTSHAIYYTIIFSIIFVPLMLGFLWFYYKIAKLIWLQRKKINYKTQNSNSSETVETSADTKTNNRQSPIVVKKKINKTSRLHMERKIRTFKIILIIMLVFFICRMPHWVFNMMKYYNHLDSSHHWVAAYSLSLLLIFNTTLNPFLYSFLNQTIMYFDKFFISIGDFISNICCCCCSNTEFAEFENDSPFFENYEPRPSQTSSIVPRGPYVDYENKHNNVRFGNVAVINAYPKESSSQKSNTY